MITETEDVLYFSEIQTHKSLFTEDSTKTVDNEDFYRWAVTKTGLTTAAQNLLRFHLELGFTLADIGKMLNIPLKTVENRYNAAITLIKESCECLS